MPTARPNVKTKRYAIPSITRSSFRKIDHIFPKSTALFPLHVRQNWLNTLLLLSLFDPMNQVGKLEQICHAKGCATSSHHHTGIRGGMEFPRNGGVGEEKDGRIDTGGCYGQISTDLHQGIQATGSNAFCAPVERVKRK